MYRAGDDGAIYASLPPNMQNVEMYALGKAFDRQIKKLMLFCQKLSFWADLEKLPPKYYDYAAATLRALYYRSEYTDSVKLQILRQALQIYKFAGTEKAVELLANTVFADAKFVPWYEYDGEPYHFKMVLPTVLTEEAFLFIADLIWKVKAARSIFDGIEAVDYQFDVEAYAGAGGISYPNLIVTNSSGEKAEKANK